MEALRDLLERAHEAHPDDPYVRTRLSVMRRREGRHEEALELLRGQAHPLAVGQHAINRLALAETAGGRAGVAEEIIRELPHRLPPEPLSAEAVEARTRLEAAWGCALEALGRQGEAHARFVRAEAFAEALGDTVIAAQAAADAARNSPAPLKGSEFFQARLEQVIAEGSDAIRLHGAARRLAEAAWAEDAQGLLEQAISYLPEGDEERLAYEHYLSMARGDARPPPSRHPIVESTELAKLAADFTRAEDALEREVSAQLAERILDSKPPAFASDMARAKYCLWRALIHIRRMESIEACRELAQAARLINPRALVSRALMEGLHLELELRMTSPRRETLSEHLGALVGLLRSMDAAQFRWTSVILSAYAPHALNGVAPHAIHSCITSLLSQGILPVRGRQVQGALLGGELPPPAVVTRHRDALRTGGWPRSVLILKLAEHLLRTPIPAETP